MGEVVNYKHLGILKTGKRVVVVMNRIPSRTDHCLIVDIDSLQDKFLDDLMMTIRGPAQKFDSCEEILSQTVMSYTGKSILETLHLAGKISPVLISSVTMTPNLHQTIPLEKVLEKLEGYVAPPAIDIIENQNIPPVIDESLSTNAQAKELLIVAKMMEDDAQVKRNQAYALDPSLKVLEEQLIVDRINEASTSKVFYINIGDLPKDKVKEVLENMRSQFTDATPVTEKKTRKPRVKKTG